MLELCRRRISVGKISRVGCERKVAADDVARRIDDRQAAVGIGTKDRGELIMLVVLQLLLVQLNAPVVLL